jgi:RND family efflux transporter MFP subunit
MAFESTIKVQEESLRLKQSEISLRQAEARIEAQKKMDSADVTALELKIKQAQADLDKALEQLTQMTVKAPAPGLVVYQKIWTGSSIEKIKVGDTPWRGQNLIELPDLSKMQVATEISEVEIGKLEKGQTVTVKLDAFPDPTFYGQVSDIASLAREKEGESDLKVFDVLIDLEKPDKLLKPGMTAKATILVEKIPDQIFIPIEAVFEKEGRKIAYIIDGSVKPINLELGKRNDNFVIVLNGLKAGQIVSLVDPLRPRETMSEDTKAKSISVPD